METNKQQEYYPGIEYQELFNHMSKEHGLNLTQSQMYDISILCPKIVRMAKQPEQIETQHVESAEERNLYSIIEQREELIGELIRRNKKLEKEREEYASLRVAQEKAELIEKLKALQSDGESNYYNAGVQEGIGLIKNS